MADFHERMIELRKERGLSQYSFAEAVHSTRSTISGYEVEGKEPNFAQLIAFADYFGVSVDYLLGRTDQRKPGPPSGDAPVLSFEERVLIRDYRKLSKKGVTYLQQQLDIALTVYK